MKKYLATYGKPRFLGIVTLNDIEYDSIKRERLVVVISHRGEEFAEIICQISEKQEQEYRSMRTISEHGEGPVRGGDPVVTDLNFMRAPSDDDLGVKKSQLEAEDESLIIGKEFVEWHQLPIKLVDAEILLDEKKLFFYFTSDQRVDFRTLVKDLARRFKTRIELRQMGVRDEARIIRGLSSCGLPCCCSYWLNQFVPIGIKMVKEQNIALNPAKISGICGRLMCCMAFEHKSYKDLWIGLPGSGSKIKTPNGNFIVLSMDIVREAVRCHKPTGGDIFVPVSLFGEFRQAVMNGEDWEPPHEKESELNCGKSEPCSGCSIKLTDQSINRSELYSVATKDDKTEGALDQGEKLPRRRTGRKRGRRGGRSIKPTGEVASVAESVQEQKSTKPNDRPRKQSSSVPKPVAPDAARPDVTAGSPGEADKPKRPKRRRRRPKRPGTGVTAENTE